MWISWIFSNVERFEYFDQECLTAARWRFSVCNLKSSFSSFFSVFPSFQEVASIMNFYRVSSTRNEFFIESKWCCDLFQFIVVLVIVLCAFHNVHSLELEGINCKVLAELLKIKVCVKLSLRVYIELKMILETQRRLLSAWRRVRWVLPLRCWR